MSRSYRPDRSREDVEDRRSPPAPGTITAIRSQDRDPDRVSVFIDGIFAFGLGREVAASAGLAAGDDLDASQIQEVLAQETRQRALSSSLTYLAHRPRTEGEIRSRLQRDGHDEDTIDATLVRLRDWHYVDDSDFARRWVENREEYRPRGVRLLATELRQKGVAPDIISQTIEDAGIDEDAGALDLARKRARQLGDLEPDIRARRLAGHLARRGYSWDVIRRTLEHLDSEAEANRDD